MARSTERMTNNGASAVLLVEGERDEAEVETRRLIVSAAMSPDRQGPAEMLAMILLLIAEDNFWDGMTKAEVVATYSNELATANCGGRPIADQSIRALRILELLNEPDAALPDMLRVVKTWEE